MSLNSYREMIKNPLRSNIAAPAATVQGRTK